MRYRRAYQPGASYFFTVVTHNRTPIFDNPEWVDLLHTSVRLVMAKHPFTLDAAVILPDHLHCIWTMPENDADYSLRWQLIKTHFTRESGIKPAWQKRFWEHLIRDDADYQHHLDYIHYNPVKHGYVNRPGDWPHSSFQRFVERGAYPADWGESEIDLPENIGHE